MVSPAYPYIEAFQLASAALKEGASALFQAEADEGDSRRQGRAYAGQVIAEAFTQIKAATRRYMNTPEHLSRTPQIILSHEGVRAAVLDCANNMALVEPFIGVPAQRIAATLRTWVGDGEPGHAALIAMSCDAANKIAKTMSARAA